MHAPKPLTGFDVAVAVGAPLLLAVLEIFHPHVHDWMTLDLRTWLTVHYAQIPLFMLAALAVAILIRGQQGIFATLARVAINGVNVTEGSWNAAIAGQFNVPVIMMSGDDAAIAEVRKAIGNIEAAETKRTLGFHSANTLTPQASYTAIGQHVTAAFKRIGDFKPYKIPGPLTVEVTFKNYLPAEVLAYLPMFERADSHSIRFRAKDMAEASAIMNFIGEYRPDLTP